MGLTRGSKTLLTFVVCFLHFINVGSTPLQITPLQIIGVNNTVPNSILLNNVSVMAPSPPPSIELTIDHNINKKLLALGMYLNAIEAILQVGRMGWDDKPISPKGYRVRAVGPGVWAKGYDVQIDIKNSQKPEDPLQLKTSYIVTGLWETMVQVSRENLYYETVLTLKQHYREIGTVTITEPTLGATANVTNSNTNLLSNPALNADLTQAVPANLTARPDYPFGRVVDPKDPRNSLFYTYTGTQIKSRDVFMAVLGLLADAVQYTSATRVKRIQQVSPSKRCAIVLTTYLHPFSLSYGFASNGLGLLLSMVMLPLEKFGEMTFQLEYQGYRVADGFVKALNPAPGVTAE